MATQAKEGDKGKYHPRNSDTLYYAIVQRILRGSLVDLLVEGDEGKYEAVSIQVVEGAVEARHNQRYFVLGNAELDSAVDDEDAEYDEANPVDESDEEV